MDDSIHKGLEDYLSGSASPEFLRLLDLDPRARQEVEQIKEISSALRTLRPQGEIAVPNFFYTRLAASIEQGQRARSAWNPFSFESVFGRRVALASLLTVAVMGTYLVTREDSGSAFNSSPEAIMASHDVTQDHDPAADRPGMMVTLASYNGR